MKTLLVDDEPYVVEYLKHLADWRSLGYNTVLSTTAGSTAKELLTKERPDLLVTDIRMPGINGLDLLKFTSEVSPKTVVIVLSGYSEFSYAQQAVKFGAIDYLLKPITAKDLVMALKKAADISASKYNVLLEKNLEPSVANDKNNCDVITVLCKYINEHYSERLSLEMLSEMVYKHPNYISRVFKQCTGKTFNSYITDVRLEKAAYLLKESTLKVQDICEMVGYYKVQYFIKLFKNKYSATPEKFRLTFINNH